MRIVLDSNIIIAGFATRGLCESLLELCFADHQVYLSDELLAEINRALIKKIKLPQAVVVEILSWLQESAKILQPVKMPLDMCRDKNDLHVLGLAAAANADYLVTGDEDLLVLRKIGKTTAIVTPRQFWEGMRKPR